MRVALRLAPLGASCEVETWFVGVPAAAAAPPPPPRKRRGEEEEEEEDGPSRRPRPGFCPPLRGQGRPLNPALLPLALCRLWQLFPIPCSPLATGRKPGCEATW